MKKNKLLIVVLIAVLMTVGLFMASCRIGCEGAGTCDIDKGEGSFCSTNGCAATKAFASSLFLSKSSGKCDC